MEKIIIWVFAMILLVSTVTAIAYEWVGGQPVKSDETNFEWVGGQPYIVMNGTVAEAPPEDTCSCPASGDWVINCADNCVIDDDCSMPNNDIHTYGTGTLEINALIDARNVFNRCNLFCYNTPSCFG